MPARVSPCAELSEQPRLADPGLTHEPDRSRASTFELPDEPVERAEFRGPPDELLANGHVVSRA